MLPDSVISSSIVKGRLLYPCTLARTALSDWALGAAAIGDNTDNGRPILWEFTLDGHTVNATPEGGAPVPVLTVPDNVVFLSADFDTNTRPVITYQIGTTTYHYWYDTVAVNYVTSTYAGATRAMVEFDDKRPTSSQSADVIVAYIKAGALYFRAQRDRYTIEYFLDSAPGIGKFARMGMADNYRFDFVFTMSGNYHA